MNDETPARLLLGTSGVAKALGVSPTHVHALVDRGVLRCSLTDTNRRVFDLADVVALSLQREAKRP